MDYSYDTLLVRQALRKMIDAAYAATESEELCNHLVVVGAGLEFQLDQDAMARREAQGLDDLFFASPDEATETEEQVNEQNGQG